MTQVDACMATVDHDRQGQAADGTNHAQWLRALQVKTMHKTFLSTRGSAHDFSVKLISRVCVAVVAALTREMAAVCQRVCMATYWQPPSCEAHNCAGVAGASGVLV